MCETLQFLDIMCGSTTGGLGLLGLYINEDNVGLVIQTLETLTEYCQGPCHENQVSHGAACGCADVGEDGAGPAGPSPKPLELPWALRGPGPRVILTPPSHQTCIVTHESNGIDIITALILNDISPLCKYRMDLVLQLKVGPGAAHVSMRRCACDVCVECACWYVILAFCIWVPCGYHVCKHG